MSWKVIREKGIKLKGMTRRISEPEVVAFLRPMEQTLVLLRESGSVHLTTFHDGQAMDLLVEDADMARASVAYLLSCGLEVFDDLDAARASVEARTESVLDRARPNPDEP
ncbi:MAG TPA: hypothetical protein VI197_33800 [Polyangiaceae bacterium]